jgi:hypothetical protein
MIGVCMDMERYRPKTNGALSAADARKFGIALNQLRTTQQVLTSAARNCESPEAFEAAFGKLMKQIKNRLEHFDD